LYPYAIVQSMIEDFHCSLFSEDNLVKAEKAVLGPNFKAYTFEKVKYVPMPYMLDDDQISKNQIIAEESLNSLRCFYLKIFNP
jgi:hypothetical protein